MTVLTEEDILYGALDLSLPMLEEFREKSEFRSFEKELDASVRLLTILECTQQELEEDGTFGCYKILNRNNRFANLAGVEGLYNESLNKDLCLQYVEFGIGKVFKKIWEGILKVLKFVLNVLTLGIFNRSKQRVEIAKRTQVGLDILKTLDRKDALIIAEEITMRGVLFTPKTLKFFIQSEEAFLDTVEAIGTKALERVDLLDDSNTDYEAELAKGREVIQSISKLSEGTDIGALKFTGKGIIFSKEVEVLTYKRFNESTPDIKLTYLDDYAVLNKDMAELGAKLAGITEKLKSPTQKAMKKVQSLASKKHEDKNVGRLAQQTLHLLRIYVSSTSNLEKFFNHSVMATNLTKEWIEKQINKKLKDTKDV